MDKRTPLALGTVLPLSDLNGNSMECSVGKEIGRGSSCIVYEGEYRAGTGDRKIVRIKECYPYSLKIIRNADGTLTAAAEDETSFVDEKERFSEDFSLGNNLFYSDGLSDSLVNSLGIYDYNNTKYIVSTYSAQTTLANRKPASVKECVEAVAQVAKIIERIHEAGYLYLDIKPDNILYISDGVQDRVQLFDFDSLYPYGIICDKLENLRHAFRISFTKGFAPVELQLAQMNCLGPATDVFGIGALLYYLLFEKAPTVLQCRAESKYSPAELCYSTNCCDDRLLSSITDFFHHTLASYYKDRYQSMAEAAEKLGELIEYADPEKKRVFSSRLYKEDGFVGRKDELREIDEHLADSGCRCLFVSGMGGIGKSALIRQYLYSKIDSRECLYLVYHDSIRDTFIDDAALQINRVKKADVEKDNDYFQRKLQELRPLVSSNTILVLDNFEGDIDSDFLKLLDLDWKVVVVSRRRFSLKGSKSLEINRIDDLKELIRLFEHYLGRNLEEIEIPLAEQLISKVDGHTLVLELIAKQTASSRISLEQAVELAGQNGFSEIAPELIGFEKDRMSRQDTIGNVVDALFSASGLSQEKRTTLKVISILGIRGMLIQQLHDIMEWPSYQAINELEKDGWVKLSDDIVTMHPVIAEAISRWKWESVYIEAAEKLLNYFYIEIEIEATHNDYPKQLKEVFLKIIDFQKGTNKNFGSRLFSKKLDNAYNKNGIVGRLAYRRSARIMDDSPADVLRLSMLLEQAREILGQCKHIKELTRNDAYVNLLYVTILFTPEYNEEYLLAEGNEIIRTRIDGFLTAGTSELIEYESNNPIPVMRVLNLVACLYAEKSDYDAAEALIDKARRVAKKSRNKLVTAHYYDLLSEYYDIRLTGAYDPETAEEEQFLKQLCSNLQKCMHYSKRNASTDGSHLYIKSYLGLITVMIRSSSPSDKEIRKMLDETEALVNSNTLPYSSVRFQYLMVCAWYSALIHQDAVAAQRAIDKATVLYEKICKNDLDRVDCLLVPVANIYLELGEYGKATIYLVDALAVCSRHDEVAVYMNRKDDIMGYLHDVADIAAERDLY